jgi:hypothetical protein
MEVDLIGHKARVAWISPVVPSIAAGRQETLAVWLENLEPPLGGTIGFGVEIWAKDYSEPELRQTIQQEGSRALLRMQDQYRQKEAERPDKEKRTKVLKELADRLSKLL